MCVCVVCVCVKRIGPTHPELLLNNGEVFVMLLGSGLRTMLCESYFAKCVSACLLD